MEDHYQRYVQALIQQLKNANPEREKEPLKTLFLGGGTPTVLGGAYLSEILTACGEVYGFCSGAEITVETNPGTIDEASLKTLRASGVNRISIGVQSFNDDDLLLLGRTHRKDKSIAALFEAAEAGFTNISLDLMYGLPGQSLESWQQNLTQAVALRPHHISAYQLTIEEQTPFYEQRQAGDLSVPEDETIVEMDRLTKSFLRTHGYNQYEISNYARTGYECQHNLRYWHNETFIGRGAGAVGYSNGVRYKILSDPLDYCLAVENEEELIEEQERLDPEASYRETVVMGLRLVKGVDTDQLLKRYGLTLEAIYDTKISQLIEAGLLAQSKTHLRLTPRGLRFANQVMAALV